MSLRSNSKSNELYVLANLDDNDCLVSFPTGGGSSTKPTIKAHDTLASAKRAQKHEKFRDATIVRMAEWEIIQRGE